ncbi:4'-phosphopantetheinyl transferase superfamily protein [Streptomyces sp. NA02950]|uniref:4'-phosphopantetheinyl transferase family protein n=1 Tax=Streptomyces sp. NA02950 TaxID=2742137 RepID=UPI0015907096|nr:4'-phosphopantetheinyl transferase superfamily protein [Streptomyces sp. NA02950]QKV90516.1 4'-phosphopantetheinyl transferase superfamily protein [Streptomyces sp. NA02950]
MPRPTAQVWLVDVDDEEATTRARALLPAAEVDRLSTVLPRHRGQRMGAQAALRALVADAIGSTPLLVRLERGPGGKPRVAGGSGPHVNLAHSGRFAAVALTAAGPVGVDVEQPRGVSSGLADLARTAMSDREYGRWRRLTGPAAQEALFRSWTHKEAVLKALGVGLCGDLRAVSTRPGGNGETVLETVPEGGCPPAQWTLHDLFDAWRLPAAVAVAAPEVEVVVHRRRLADLLPARRPPAHPAGPSVAHPPPLARKERVR